MEAKVEPRETYTKIDKKLHRAVARLEKDVGKIRCVFSGYNTLFHASARKYHIQTPQPAVRETGGCVCR